LTTLGVTPVLATNNKVLQGLFMDKKEAWQTCIITVNRYERDSREIGMPNTADAKI